MSYAQGEPSNGDADLVLPQTDDPPPDNSLSNHLQVEFSEGEMKEFFSRVESVRENIEILAGENAKLCTLHAAALASTVSCGSAGLESHVTKMDCLTGSIKDQISALGRHAFNDQGKRKHVDNLAQSFRDQLLAYQAEESRYRNKYREQIARQYRIANQDATEEEVQQAMDADWGDEGLFQTALKGNNLRDARSVRNEVATRHGDIKRIEKTLLDIATLYEDLGLLVLQPEPYIEKADMFSKAVLNDIEKSEKELEKSRQGKLRTRRLKRWACLALVLIILIAAAVAGLYIKFRPH